MLQFKDTKIQIILNIRITTYKKRKKSTYKYLEKFSIITYSSALFFVVTLQRISEVFRKKNDEIKYKINFMKVKFETLPCRGEQNNKAIQKIEKLDGLLGSAHKQN